MKIGYIGIAEPYSFNYNAGEKEYLAGKKLLETIPGVEVIAAAKPVIELHEMEAAKQQFLNQGIDLLVVQNATFGSGEVFIRLVEGLPDPVVLWGLPEPRGAVSLQHNSLCGVNMHASFLAQMNRKFKYFYASADEAFLEEFTRWLNVFSLTKELRESRIGLFGAHTPGFYAFGINELSLRETLGPLIHHIDLSEVYRESEKLTEEEIAEVRSDIRNTVCNADEMGEDKNNLFARTNIAFENLVERYKLDAVAVKCWSEFIVDYGQCVCGSMSRLVEKGIMAGCEGDILGTITSMVQHRLSGTVPFISDLVQLDQDNSEAVLWHCGCAPASLAGTTVNFGKTFGINGMNVDFSLKGGPATVARISVLNGEYRLLAARGRMIPDRDTPAGTGGVMKLECDGKKLMDTIIYGGYEHHLGLCYGDILEDLEEFARLIGIKAVIVR